MRIAVVTETWKPSVNGVVTRLSATVDALSAAGHEVLVVAPSQGAGDAAVAPQPGVTLSRVPSFRVGWVYGGQPWGWPLPRVRGVLARFAPDVVHVADPFTLGLAGVWAARRLHVPLVTSFHTDIAAYAGWYHLAWSRPVIWRILRALHNAAALTLVTSQHSSALLAGHGVRDVVVWRRGVDLERFHPAAGRVPRPGTPTALYVGRLAQEKHLDALSGLAFSPHVRLVLVGDGPDRPRLQQHFAGTDTVFAGVLTGDDLARAYRDADVFVFPSATETLGLVLIEALASGLPIVAAESPASRELLHGLSVARLVSSPAATAWVDAVDGLLGHPPAGGLAAAARAAADPWSWTAATDQLMAVYARVTRPSPAVTA